ncbi:MAG: hypothetical protein IAE67_05510 [Candidatus Competibacteraceae bacterium]|nr:hypothetical protein [Candidatus Competibacteraceae bacterium]
MEYPNNHKAIVQDLMRGKFILSSEKEFDTIKTNEVFYRNFFSESFGMDFHLSSEYACLVSSQTHETLSRTICIFFAILCYELDKDGKNFMDCLQYNEFEMEEIDTYFENTSYIDLVRATRQLEDAEKRRMLIDTMRRRNIVERTGNDRFVFTPAYKVFTGFAMDLSRRQTNGKEHMVAES